MADQSLADRLRAAMNEARKQRDQARTILLSTILSDVKNREIELGHTPTDDETAEVLRRGVKKRKESVEAYEKVGRTEQAQAEANEIKILESFLPAQISADEIRAAVRETIAGGATDMGNLLWLCPYHHRLVHEGGWQIKGDPDGEVIFVRPDGRPLPTGRGRAP